MRCSWVIVEDEPDLVQFVWTHHHICVDGWSVAIVLAELQALLKGADPLEMPTNVPYKEYIAWLHRQDNDKAREFWQDYLKGVSSPTPLPKLKYYKSSKDASVEAKDTGKYFVKISTEETSAILQYCQENYITMFTLLQAAWALLLNMYSSADNIVFGGTFSGRSGGVSSDKSFETIVGLLINTLPVRIDVAPFLLLSDWLSSIQAAQAKLVEFEHTPLVKTHGWSEFPPGTPLFETIVIFENYPTSPEDTNLIREMEAFEKTNMSLGLAAQLVDKSLNLILAYNQQKYGLQTITKLGTHLSSLIRLIVESPKGTRIDGVMKIQDEDSKKMMKWNRDAVTDRKGLDLIHKEFEKRAEEFPDSIAIVFGDDQITYRELNSRANKLAHFLRSIGISHEDSVGYSFDRSVDVIVTMLAILKAGATMVPIPPTLPAERFTYILNNACCKILITSRFEDVPIFRNPGSSAESFGVPLIPLSTYWNYINANMSDANPDISVHPLMIMYMIYTSGTTGKPKGVQIQHNNLRSRLTWWIKQLQQDVHHRVLQTIPLGFDPSMWEIFAPLVMGWCLDLFRPGKNTDVVKLRNHMMLHRITTLSFTPALLNVTLDDGYFDNECVVVWVGGEKLPEAILGKFWNVFPEAVLNDNYGPTETTICVTNECYTRIPPSDHERTIGYGVDDVSVHIMGRDLHPTPVGVEGELCIAGIGLARGYLNNPFTTAASFLPSPFALYGERLYKTGDICRFHDTGKIVISGRKDDQTKIRGYRVELQEIEVVLKECEEVSAALVTAVTWGNNKHLVAYVSPKLSAEEIEEVRARCGLKMPEYMVPTFIIPIVQFPISPATGKIDRSALPQPQFQKENEQDHYFPPTNETEKILEQIWCELLHLEKVSIHSNFYSLGGDSIVSIQIVSQANQKGIQLTVRDMLTYTTIHKLAEVSLKRTIHLIEAPQHALDCPSIPLSPVQRFFFLDFGLLEHNHFNQAYSLHLTNNPLTVEQWTAISLALVTHHDMLRAVFTQVDSKEEGDCGWVQSVPPTVADKDALFEYIDLSEVSNEVKMEQFEKEMNKQHKSFDISQGRVFKLVLIKLSPTTHRIIVLAHHLVIDGISSRAIVEDLIKLYNAYSSATSEEVQSPLSAKTNSFAQWVDKVIEYSSCEELAKEEAYWQEVSKNAALLPIDSRARASNTYVSYSVVNLMFEPTMTSTLLQLSRGLEVSIDRLILGALLHSLSKNKWFTSDDHESEVFNIDTESHGRSEAIHDLDTTRTVGWFTTAYPMKLKKSSNLRATVLAIHEAMKVIPNKGFGYSALRYIKRSKVLTSRTSDILFNHLGTFGSDTSDLVQDWDFISDEPSGMPIGEEGLRTHILDVNSNIMSNKLNVSFGYSSNIFSEEKVQRLSESFKEVLLESIHDVRHIFSPVSARRHLSLVPLIMIHPVDGNVSGLTGLGLALERPYLVLTYPEPSELRGHPFSTLQEMAAFHIQEIERVYPRGPYVLVGYSFGALLAFEIILQLLKKGTPIDSLIILDLMAFSPEDKGQRIPTETNAFGTFLMNLVQNFSGLSFTDEEKHQLLQHTPREEVPELPLRVAQSMSEVQKEFISHRLEIYRNCSQALNYYDIDSSKSKLEVPLLVVTANSAEERPEDLGWRDFTTHKVYCSHINTNHYELLGKDSLPFVASSVTNFLSTKKRRPSKKTSSLVFSARIQELETGEGIVEETPKPQIQFSRDAQTQEVPSEAPAQAQEVLSEAPAQTQEVLSEAPAQTQEVLSEAPAQAQTATVVSEAATQTQVTVTEEDSGNLVTKLIYLSMGLAIMAGSFWFYTKRQ
eukprot:TRINITY_DN2356_c0_g1_i1.p1 TRINITY_DN2356_c0_g1~~TRINITY_DN2356_c0_g1_i1.p1  ORF type:complete len:1812 (-),score=392.14 TRINITY_DN2356_c0_g1_i1:133-5568(-)